MGVNESQIGLSSRLELMKKPPKAWNHYRKKRAPVYRVLMALGRSVNVLEEVNVMVNHVLQEREPRHTA